MTQAELIEAIARELERAFQGLTNNFHPYETVLSKEASEHLARSILPVIRAALEPTGRMIKAGTTAAEKVEEWTQDSFTTYRVDCAEDMAIPVFNAMLRASALGEGVE